MKNRTMMQYFEWYLPNNGLHWKRCAAQAKELKEAGINMVWLPPAYKGAAGKTSVGYDVYDAMGHYKEPVILDDTGSGVIGSVLFICIVPINL